MQGKLYIDTIDIYSSFGIFISEGGSNGVVGFPPMKKVDSNDWMDEDGIEVDLSSPTLDTREFSIDFIAHGKARTEVFFELLSDGAYHTFDFKSLGRVLKLRMVSQPNLDMINGIDVFSVQFALDFPLPEKYIYTTPNSTLIPTTGYELDGVDFASYGVRVLGESLAEVRKSPAIKKNILTNLQRQHGATYIGKAVYYQPKDVKLNCLMRATTLGEFWRNYDALLHDLTRPDERTLFVDDTSSYYQCYYKSSTVEEFMPTDKTWFKFSLNLVFTLGIKGI